MYRRLKVVAVFAAGPDWQFKGWKWGEVGKPGPDGRAVEPDDVPPVKIFNRALGFHVHFDAEPPHPNAAAWAVTPLAISKTRRYLDAGVSARFWRAVDDHIFVRKPYLLPKGAGGSSA
jgi:parafibromin